MTAFTRLGSSIWDWEPWTELGTCARVLWLALFTSAEAKRHVPGLWQGGIPMMADAAHMSADDVRLALDQLLERETVEFDARSRVLRLCHLPDAGEFPSNGKVILGWWTRFKTVPACPVRDAHVRTLQWILDTGAERRGTPLTPDHANAWRTTFGTIQIPAPRKRGIRRLTDLSDTSTSVQPSLFGSPVGTDMVSAKPSDRSPPQEIPMAVDNSNSLRQLKENKNSETVSDTVSDTNRIPDPGSRILDLSPERGSGGGHETGMRPALTLVPPYTAGDVLRVMAGGRWDASHDGTYRDAVGSLIAAWVAKRVALEDFQRLAEYTKHAQVTMSARYLVGCDLPAEIDRARKTLDWRDIRMADMARLP
jgi:hypothetical protein